MGICEECRVAQAQVREHPAHSDALWAKPRELCIPCLDKLEEEIMVKVREEHRKRDEILAKMDPKLNFFEKLLLYHRLY